MGRGADAPTARPVQQQVNSGKRSLASAILTAMSRSRVVYHVVVWVARALYRIMGWRIQIEGGHLLPATGPVVVAANHVSHLDPLHLGLAITRLGRYVAFMAKRELFQHPIAGPLLRTTGHIEVDRGGEAARALQPAVAALRRGGVVAVFPEGTISTSFVPCPPRLGAARMALDADAPIVPVAVWGGQRVITKGRNNLRPPFRKARGVVMTVTFGAPVIPHPGEDAGQLMARVWEAVGRLTEQAARRYADGSPAEGAWWLPAHLGGSAPTVMESLQVRAAEAHARRERQARTVPAGDRQR